MRTPVVAGNWKMHLTREEAAGLTRDIKEKVGGEENVKVILCPPFTALDGIVGECRGSNIQVGAQNMHWEDEGAFTGEISPLMLKDIGCKYVILGHSERRHVFGETDEDVNKKLLSAVRHNIRPILCVGETLEQREEGVTDTTCREQLEKGLEGLSQENAENIIIAYEPVWAIGTGKSASAKDAEHVNNYIRIILSGIFSKAAELIPILYGGSVKPDNIDELMAQPNIDGVLVGGASLNGDSFTEIIRKSALKTS
ncbi:MAG: triose-phosphate isomerase [Clostridia bacterium]|nr:triose-phosphate isomerase [Clostridia bacterium]